MGIDTLREAKSRRRVKQVDTRIGTVHLRSLVGKEFLHFLDNQDKANEYLVLLSLCDEEGCATDCYDDPVSIKEESLKWLVDECPADVLKQLIDEATSFFEEQTAGNPTAQPSTG